MAANPVCKPNTSWNQTGKNREYTPGGGWVTVKVYQGPRETIEATLASIAAQSPAPTKIISNETGDPARIDAYFSTPVSGYNEDQSAQDNAIWELDPVEIQKRLESHPRFKGSGKTQAQHAQIIEDINNSILNGTAANKSWATDGAFYDRYRDMRLVGIDSYPLYTWIIRSTISVSATSTLKAAFANVNRVIPYASIGVPSTVKWGAVSIYWWSDDAWRSVNLSDGTARWLCKPPRVMWDSRTAKHQIQSEWWGAMEFSSFLYDGGTGAI